MKKISIIAGISFLTGALFFALTFGYLQKTEEKITVLSPNVAQAETISMQGVSFAPLVKKVRPAVVKVRSMSLRESSRSPFGDDMFERFFNRRPQSPQRVPSMGSGFFISEDGYIITNNHVVDKALSVTIRTIDNKKYKAKIVGTDPKTDIALLKVKGKNFPFIRMGDSNTAEVGEWVLAIGNPLNQDLSVTAGIISAKGREMGLADYEDFLQTDAAINRGNSGGPLVNMNGEVIGITSAILSPTGGNIGLGFAIPSSMAKDVVKDLKEQGRVIRGYLGITMSYYDEEMAKDSELPTHGALVNSVEKDSPAEAAGMKRYDLIIKVDGKRITSATDLKIKIARTKPGDIVTLTLMRQEEEKIVKVKVAEAPDTLTYRSSGTEDRSYDLGMVLIKNTPAIAKEYELKTSKGVLVREVRRNGAAYKSGIRGGDVILEANRKEVNSVNEFRKIISAKKPGSMVMLYVYSFQRQREGILNLRLPE